MKPSTTSLAALALLFVTQAACAAPLPIQTPGGSLRLGDSADGDGYDAPFFADARYSGDVTDPASLLGQITGSRMATDLELRACFEAWAKESDRVTLHEHGASHEKIFNVAASNNRVINSKRREYYSIS